MAVSELLIDSILTEQFGLSQFRPKQKEVIDLVLQGNHALALLPTGYGKSLCYQVPSQVLPGTTLVVSPLIALMQDQVNGLLRRGIKNATFLNSSVPPGEQDIRFGGIRNGDFKLVYVAPERFESPRFRSLLASIKVSLLVIDEAHCISQWGHDFRPQYRNLTNHVALLKDATVLALTATATPAVQRDIVQLLNLPGLKVVAGSFDRPNIRFAVESVQGAAEKDATVDALLSESKGPAIVYTATRKDAEATAGRLARAGTAAACYHAGLSLDARHRTQRDFETDKISVIVSTVAFGMGVDKGNISTVIHYNLPGSLENYYQEAGRAGRNGQPATCTLVYQAKDIYTQRWLMERNYPTPAQVHAVQRLIHGYGGTPVRIADLSTQLDIADAALNSAVDLLKHLKIIGTTADGALELLDEAGGPDRPIDLSSLHQRKQRDDLRLQRIIDYARTARCRRRQILDYFGQRLESCSGCDVCHPAARVRPILAVRESAIKITPRSTASTSIRRAGEIRTEATKAASESLPLSILQLAQELSGKVGRTTLALILVGSRSKKLKERELDQHALYGRYSFMKDDQVLPVIDQLIAGGQLKSITGMYPKVSITAEGIGMLSTLETTVPA